MAYGEPARDFFRHPAAIDQTGFRVRADDRVYRPPGMAFFGNIFDEATRSLDCFSETGYAMLLS